MNKSSKKVFPVKHKSKQQQEYNELIDMMESGMEDYEIAEELGLTPNYVSELKRHMLYDIIF